jgi:putative transposase
MARQARLFIPGCANHVIQRGHNRAPVFRLRGDYETYLDCLTDASCKHGVQIHAYVLMTNHVHLLLTAKDSSSLALMMQSLGRQYVGYFNKRYERSGTLWEGRFRSTVVAEESYFMRVMRYIELNPVRAGIVTLPSEYPWSSYQYHVGTSLSEIVSDHSLYWRLGNTPFERQSAYRGLVDELTSAEELRSITDATIKGWQLGAEQAADGHANRRPHPVRRGRRRLTKPDSVPI